MESKVSQFTPKFLFRLFTQEPTSYLTLSAIRVTTQQLWTQLSPFTSKIAILYTSGKCKYKMIQSLSRDFSIILKSAVLRFFLVTMPRLRKMELIDQFTGSKRRISPKMAQLRAKNGKLRRSTSATGAITAKKALVSSFTRMVTSTR